MRLWSLHPRYLDRAGLVAGWREGLLAQAVLAGRTRGYTRHPQLERFREHDQPLPAIARFLHGLADEADIRGYRFDRTRVREAGQEVARIPVTDGQLRLERDHLVAKLELRNPDLIPALTERPVPEPHPLFAVLPGPAAEWERAAPNPHARSR